MILLDKYLPRHDFREIHFRDIAAPPAAVMEAAEAFDPASDAFFRHMIALRELPMRLMTLAGRKNSSHADPFGLQNFTFLEKLAGEEIAFGLAGAFWKADYGLVDISDGEAFRSLEAPGVARLALGFSARVLENGRTRLTTETRVFCPDPSSRRKFTPYWYIIRPVSGMIRGRMLASIKASAEAGV